VSEQRSEILTADFTVTENGCEKAWPNRLTGVHGHDGRPAIGMT
jgi:hypothetical protein